MPSKQSQRRQSAKQRKSQDMAYRSLSLPASLDVSGRTVQTVIATEEPVLMPDYERFEMVPEILLTSGLVLPDSRQVPLLDSHQRDSTSTQIGSAREIRVDGSQVVGTLHFSSTAEDQWTKVREGHVTDVSAGYQALAKTYIPKDNTQTIQGKSYAGPLNVVTKWKLREVSVTPIGADEQAKLRGFDPTAEFDAEQETFVMNPELRKLLETRGMPAELNDDQAQAWLVANPGKLADPPTQRNEVVSVPINEQVVVEAAERAAKAAFDRMEQERSAFRASVLDLCELAGFPEEVRTCSDLGSLDKVREYLKTKRAELSASQHVSPQLRVTGDGMTRMLEDMGTALSLRSMEVVSGNVESDTAKKVFPIEKRSKDADRWRNAGLYQMAERFVQQRYGLDPNQLTREDVAKVAMFGPEQAGLESRSESAFHTTGSFTKLTMDAVNKSMQLGYVEAPSTWEQVMRVGPDARDFKTIHRMRMGGIPNLPVWPDNQEPEKASLADAEEKYSVESRSVGIDFSYRLLVNDDLDALSRIPGQMGAAARRTVNAVAWSVITSNPTMTDGVALFAAATGNRKRTNLTTGSGAPSVTTVQTLTNLMMQMRGENTPEGNESEDVLALMPRYIVHPSALFTTVGQLVNSAYDPSTGVSAAGVYNPCRTLIPVCEPLLDANSTTAWYLFADPRQIDTVEVTFLQGQRTPQVRSNLNFQTLSQEMYILQTFGVKAMNHRGLQKHAGA